MVATFSISPTEQRPTDKSNEEQRPGAADCEEQNEAMPLEHGRILFECNRESIHFCNTAGAKVLPVAWGWDLSVIAARFPRRRAG